MSPFRGCEETQSESEDKDEDEDKDELQRRGLLRRSFNTQVAGDPRARREDVVDINLVKQEVPGGARAYVNGKQCGVGHYFCLQTAR